ncbi:MAG TPA: hypothetical protein VF069_15030 [Streptosporangiaceae bacterium]
MTRMESAVWPLACGGACAFAIAVVLGGAPSRTAGVVLAGAMAAWSLRAPVLASVLLGCMAWLFLTGFDVNTNGALRFTGRDDLLRLTVLIASALTGAAVGRLLVGPAPRRVVEGMPAPPEEYAPPERHPFGASESSKIADGRSRRPGAVPHAVPRDSRRSGISN